VVEVVVEGEVVRMIKDREVAEAQILRFVLGIVRGGCRSWM